MALAKVVPIPRSSEKRRGDTVLLNTGKFCRKGITDMSNQSNKPLIKNKKVIIDLFVLWLALTALSCAAINLHISLNKLEQKEE